MDFLKRLVDRIHAGGDLRDPETPSPLLSLEEFFEGNHDPASICSNLAGGVVPAEMFEAFQQVRSRSNVANVLVQVDGHHDPDEWPLADTVWVITSAEMQQVALWVPPRLAPDDMFDGFRKGRAIEAVAIADGMRAVGLWYD